MIPAKYGLQNQLVGLVYSLDGWSGLVRSGPRFFLVGLVWSMAISGLVRTIGSLVWERFSDQNTQYINRFSAVEKV